MNDLLKNGYAGRHVIIELWNVDHELLGDSYMIKKILENSVLESQATILDSIFHHFGEGYGVTGVVVLAESHASIHTWPEINYAAVDIFMCGDCNPMIAAEAVVKGFCAQNFDVREIIRGDLILKSDGQ